MRKWGPVVHVTSLFTWTAHLLPSTWSDTHASYRNCLLGDRDIFLSWGRCGKFLKRRKTSPEVSQVCFFQLWLELCISSQLSGDVLWQEGRFCLSSKQTQILSPVTCLAGASRLLRNMVALASLPAYRLITGWGGSTATAAANVGAEGRERGLELCQDLGGAGKQPTAEVSGSCGAGKLVAKVRTRPSSLKERQSIPFPPLPPLCPLHLQGRWDLPLNNVLGCFLSTQSPFLSH